jgi:transcriptional regulator with XRE-family HTH domain
MSERFGPWLRAERERREVGLREMAERVGISATYLSRLETAQARAAEGLVTSVRFGTKEAAS